ncbi:MAG: hypothetical protein KAT71_08420 [Gammaproteobacteria bacterium]|nr:hypothetical protein [Gammaproteobacteria bacterium]
MEHRLGAEPSGPFHAAYLGIEYDKLPTEVFSYDFGYNKDVDPGAEADIWSVGGEWTQPVDTGETVEIVSSSVDDTQIITVEGLDVNFKPMRGFAELAGTTPVHILVQTGGPSSPFTIGVWSRILTMVNFDDTGLKGVVRASKTGTPASVYSEILLSNEQSSTACTTIPAEYIGIFKAVSIGLARTAAAGNASISLRTRNHGGAWRRVAGGVEIQSDGSSTFHHDAIFPLYIPPKADVKLSAEVSVINMSVWGILGIKLVRA